MESRAFTIVELLVVIAIVAVLAGLAFPVLGSMRLSSDLASGVQAQKSIGAALTQYIAESGGKLPTLKSHTQFVVKEKNAGDGLMLHLAPYLGAEHLKATDYVPGTASKAFLRQENPVETACYWLPFRTTELLDGTKATPFGTRWDPGAVGVPVVTIANPSRQVALIDTMPSGDASLPKKPIYGNRRVAMFFDFHVEVVATNFPWSTTQP